MINEAANLLRIVYTSAEGFNTIVYKDSRSVVDQFRPSPDHDGSGIQRRDEHETELDRHLGCCRQQQRATTSMA